MKKAFTILELIFVVIILGILAAIALPKLGISKDEAIISKSLSNLKTFINDVSIYALKNDTLSSTNIMSNVNCVSNVNLSNIKGQKQVNFKIQNDENCVNLLFIDKENILLLGIVSNENTKNLILNIADLENELSKNPNDQNIKSNLQKAYENLENADFTNNTSKICTSLTNSNSYKDLAKKTYILLGK